MRRSLSQAEAMLSGGPARAPRPRAVAWPQPDEAAARGRAAPDFGFFWDGRHPVSGLAPDRCSVPRASRAMTRSADRRLGVRHHGHHRGRRARLDHARSGARAAAAHARRADRATCYHGAFAAFPERPHGCHHSVLSQGRWRRPGRDLVPVHGAAVRAAVLRSRHARRAGRCAAGSPGCGKKSSGTGTRRAAASVLYWHWSPNNGWAMDHEIRGWNECLVTYVLAAGSPRYAIDPRGLSHGVSPAGRDFLNGKSLLRHRAAARARLRRAAVLRALFLLRTRSARPARPLRRLLGAQPAACRDQPRALHRQSQQHSRATARPAGVSRRATIRTAMSAHAPDNDNGTISPTAALASLPYAPREAHERPAALSGGAWRAALGPVRFRRCLLRAAQLVRRHLSRHRSGTDHRHDRESSHGRCCGSCS